MNNEGPKWLSVDRTYEGFPLFLRYPKGLDFGALCPKFPRLIVVTHTFTHRKSNGLPEPDYNHHLIHMDQQLVRLFNVDHMGLPVLVETFGGERNYYFYVANDFDAGAAITQVFQTFPHEKLSQSIRPDPDWSFIKKYSAEFSL